MQWDDVSVAHSGGQQRPLYSPATWEPESSDEELDQTEYTQDPLTYPSRPLSQSTSEVTRLVPRPKGVAGSSSSAGPSRAVSSGHPAKASQVTISRANPLLRAAPKVEAASSSKRSSTPKSTAASSSKGSVFVQPAVTSSSKGSAKSKSAEKGSSSKGSAKSKSAEGSSLSKGSAYPRCIGTSYLQGVKCWKFDDHSNLVEQQLSTIPVVSGRIVAFDWHQVTHWYLSCIQI